MYEREYKIKDIEFKDNGKIDDREVVVTLDNDTEIHMLCCTVDVAECANKWLHGIGEIPCEVYDFIYE